MTTHHHYHSHDHHHHHNRCHCHYHHHNGECGVCSNNLCQEVGMTMIVIEGRTITQIKMEIIIIKVKCHVVIILHSSILWKIVICVRTKCEDHYHDDSCQEVGRIMIMNEKGLMKIIIINGKSYVIIILHLSILSKIMICIQTKCKHHYHDNICQEVGRIVIMNKKRLIIPN